MTLGAVAALLPPATISAERITEELANDPLKLQLGLGLAGTIVGLNALCDIARRHNRPWRLSMASRELPLHPGKALMGLGIFLAGSDVLRDWGTHFPVLSSHGIHALCDAALGALFMSTIYFLEQHVEPWAVTRVPGWIARLSLTGPIFFLCGIEDVSHLAAFFLRNFSNT
ncbi:MAG: hypothetical protein HYV02_00920 [Deltaproteobacteria bacterium]|nr:hypothetical protein [Deltaproteobacteria bacterium]